MKNRIVISLLISCLYGCASAKKDYSYMAKSDYQSKSTLTKSLVDPSKPLSEKAIHKILNSKIKLPRRINLAVTKINTKNDFQKVDDQIAAEFYNKKNWGKRAQSIIPVPQILINSPINLNGLRHSAVLLQADMLLIIMPYSQGDWKFEWFQENKAKATTSLEVLLLDVRTGVIPFTSIITESVEVRKDEKDYNNTQLVEKARELSGKKALIQVSNQVKGFLESVI